VDERGSVISADVSRNDSDTVFSLLAALGYGCTVGTKRANEQADATACPPPSEEQCLGVRCSPAG
jgi:hypothetical protein